ncbi:MAG: sulfotransferase domain-containing protein [Anaerolineales bacterium]|nr:sulfotransferase domain-containing protein [Anaerolineales bacterium]MBX3036824.1 sulfotransferase domain-containing protein [Anaerolineales bacterium]
MFIKKPLKSLSLFYRLSILQLRNLFLSKATYIGYPNLIFIAGLPKSGTTWLAQLMQEVPGYQPAYVYDPDECSSLHNICNDIFSYIPKNGHYIMKLHTHYSPENMQVLDKFNINPIIMYRDLRDQCVSRYFHALNDPTHRHYALYNTLSKEEGMTHNLEISLEYYLSWIENWLSQIKKQPNRFYEVRYETLRADPSGTLAGVLSFYGIQLSNEQVEQIVQKIASQTKFDLKQNFQKRQNKSTARKGIVGDWRNHFSERHVQYFKEKCGQHLIDVGYEKDLNWSLEQ